MNDGYSKERIENNYKIILTLEWFGVRIEDVKEENDDSNLMIKTVYYYSVPESSTIEIDDKDWNARIKTADKLKLLAKEVLSDMLINSCKDVLPDEEEFIEDIKNNTSDYFKFYAKVRKGEIWNKEMGDNRIKELHEEIKNASQYNEV